jgi:predicted metal-dependent phosphoesterase TrpH
MRHHATVGVLALLAGAAAVHLLGHRPAPPTTPLAPPSPPAFARTFAVSRFVRGNLHTHTTRSDGDTSPADVARWYRDHGYGFLALTDHNVLTDPGELASMVTPGFALVAGEEVSMYVGGRQVHVNALCTRTVVAGGTFPRVIDALEHAIGEIRAQDGVALVNHPNFDWALTAEDVVAADGAGLLEIASGHPYVHSAGDATHPSHEQLWDAALTAGREVMGIGGDDMHHLVTDADPEAFPGIAWVEAFVDEPRVDLVCDAIRKGALYASTGVRLRAITVSGDSYEVDPVDRDATVVFIGSAGRVLARAPGAGGARYRVRGDEGYVRARVEAASGEAWTPAVRVTRGAPRAIDAG